MKGCGADKRELQGREGSEDVKSQNEPQEQNRGEGRGRR